MVDGKPVVKKEGEGRFFFLYSTGISRNMSYLLAIASDTSGFTVQKGRVAKDGEILLS